MLEYFIDVAKECINIGNFNSLMAIIGKTTRVKWDFDANLPVAVLSPPLSLSPSLSVHDPNT